MLIHHASLATDHAGMRSSSEDQAFDLRIFISMSLPVSSTWLDLLSSKQAEWEPHLHSPLLTSRRHFVSALETFANTKYEGNVHQQLIRLQKPYRKVQRFIGDIPTAEDVIEHLLAFVWNISFAVIHLGLSSRLKLKVLVDRITYLDDKIPHLVPPMREFADFPILQEPLQAIYTRYIDCYMHMIRTIRTSKKLDEADVLPSIDDSVARFTESNQEYSKLQSVAKSSISWLHRQETVNPQFKIMDPLGQGTFGTVYKVQEISTGQLYAMKRIAVGPGSSQASSEDTVRNEMKIMRKLRHHHITTLAFSTKDPQYFNLYVLPVAEAHLGGYLESPAASGYESEKIYKWFGCLIGALDYAHRNGIKHKDIKPSNILLNKNGNEILITDFGLARDYSESGISQTTGGLVVGTPKYLAPECVTNGERTEAVDVFALGCVFAEILCALGGKPSQHFDDLRKDWGGVPFRYCLGKVKEWLYDYAEGDKSKPVQQIVIVTRNMLKNHFRDRSRAEFIRSQLEHDGLRCARCPR